MPIGDEVFSCEGCPTCGVIRHRRPAEFDHLPGRLTAFDIARPGYRGQGSGSATRRRTDVDLTASTELVTVRGSRCRSCSQARIRFRNVVSYLGHATECLLE